MSRLPNWRVHFRSEYLSINTTQGYALICTAMIQFLQPREFPCLLEHLLAVGLTWFFLKLLEDVESVKRDKPTGKYSAWVWGPSIPNWCCFYLLHTYYTIKETMPITVSHCQIKVKTITEYGGLYARLCKIPSLLEPWSIHHDLALAHSKSNCTLWYTLEIS